MQFLRSHLPFCAGALLLASAAQGAQAAPKVVASIKPVHSLVAAVMEGVGEPTLLIKGAGSPHTYSLKPSEARALSRSDLVFWIGEDFEQFLVKPLKSLAGDSHRVALSEADGIMLAEVREGGVWEAHADHDEHADHGDHEDHDEHADHGDHEDHDDHAEHGDHKDHAEHEEHGDHEDHDDHAEHEDHDGHDDAHAHAHGDHDMHIWLDPDNARAMVRAIVSALSDADSANAARYESNGDRLAAALDSLDGEIAASLAPVKSQPYIVFHDAYQYFEAHYDINGVGAISVDPERAPGAKRVAALRDKIADLQAVCVFSEPQFEPAVVATVIEGTSAKTGELDPLGATLPAGPKAYFALMRDLAENLVECLSPNT